VSATARATARLAAMQESMRVAAKGFRNLVEFRLVPSSFFAESIGQAEMLEYAAGFEIDHLVDDLRNEIGEALEEYFDQTYDGGDVRAVIRKVAATRREFPPDVFTSAERLGKPLGLTGEQFIEQLDADLDVADSPPVAPAPGENLRTLTIELEELKAQLAVIPECYRRPAVRSSPTVQTDDGDIGGTC
jgi:hypothetical protein